MGTHQNQCLEASQGKLTASIRLWPLYLLRAATLTCLFAKAPPGRGGGLGTRGQSLTWGQSSPPHVLSNVLLKWLPLSAGSVEESESQGGGASCQRSRDSFVAHLGHAENSGSGDIQGWGLRATQLTSGERWSGFLVATRTQACSFNRIVLTGGEGHKALHLGREL